MPNPNEPTSGASQQPIQSREKLEALLAKRTEQLRLAVKDLECTKDLVLEAFGTALGAKNIESELHSKRVCAFSIALSRAMGLGSSDIGEISKGAFLHDIGKLAIPDEILTKPDKLTELEVAIMREHPILGHDFLKQFPFLSIAAEIVYTHHEWWDGRGYPNGLKGKSIPLGARIVAVAEAFDCISSDLPYRSAQPFSCAWKEISDWSGKQFDPDIVEAAVRIPDGLWSELRHEMTKPRMPFA